MSAHPSDARRLLSVDASPVPALDDATIASATAWQRTGGLRAIDIMNILKPSGKSEYVLVCQLVQLCAASMLASRCSTCRWYVVFENGSSCHSFNIFL